MIRQKKMLCTLVVSVLAATSCGGSDGADRLAGTESTEPEDTPVTEQSAPDTEPPKPLATDAPDRPAETTTEAPPTTTSEAPEPSEPPPTTIPPSTTLPPPTTNPLTPGQAEVTGEPLGLPSEAVGKVPPQIDGADLLTGAPVSWGGEGSGPAAILFAPLQEWCPHCHEHVADIAQFLSTNEPPAGADLLTVTQTGPPSEFYPQEDWMTEHGWKLPTVLGGADGAIAAAFGVTSVPIWIFVDAEGTVSEYVDAHHVNAQQVFEMLAEL